MARAGDLHERVRFQQKAAGTNRGGVVYAAGWSDTAIGDVRAEIKPLRGGEAVQAARLSGRDVVQVTVRGSTATRRVTADMRVVDARNPARTWNIIAPPQNPDMRGTWIVITAEAGGSDG